jgi:hypothetical protein
LWANETTSWKCLPWSGELPTWVIAGVAQPISPNNADGVYRGFASADSWFRVKPANNPSFMRDANILLNKMSKAWSN